MKISQEDGFDAKNILVLKGHKERIWDISVFNTRVIGSCSEEGCKKYWDMEFICPDKLIEATFAQVYQVLGMNRQIRDDQNPNSQEGI